MQWAPILYKVYNVHKLASVVCYSSSRRSFTAVQLAVLRSAYIPYSLHPSWHKRQHQYISPLVRWGGISHVKWLFTCLCRFLNRLTISLYQRDAAIVTITSSRKSQELADRLTTVFEREWMDVHTAAFRCGTKARTYNHDIYVSLRDILKVLVFDQQLQNSF